VTLIEMSRCVRTAACPAAIAVSASLQLTGISTEKLDVGTDHPAFRCFLDMLGVVSPGSRFNLRRERQLEGIAKAKAAGVYKGRPPSIEAARGREMKAQGMRPVDIAKALKIGRASVYRVLGAASGA
jgi:DNA invertase Pin-like site-specific DNA recombinase